MTVKIEYSRKVDLGNEKRLVVVILNEEKNTIVPLASRNDDDFAEILAGLGFGIMVEPKTISLEDFQADVNNNPILNRVDWKEMGFRK
jgi:hypothetical protein